MYRMAVNLAQVCLFKQNGETIRQFCDVVSGDLEMDDADAGGLLSYRMGNATVAHHPPMGELSENDVLVTLQVDNPRAVDRIFAGLLRVGLHVDDQPEDTEHGWRVFYFRAAPNLLFEVGAPL